MTKGNAAAVDIDLVLIQTQLLYAGKGLGGESLIKLDNVNEVSTLGSS